MAYLEKAQNYILRQGTANFGEGGLSHDVLRHIDLHGMVPQSAYPGLTQGDTTIDHGELSAGHFIQSSSFSQVLHPRDPR